jgi:Sulfite exporter TauE/SafE
MDTIGTVVPYVIVLLVAGIACGFINTLASSGSAISLPMLLTLGLPPLAANATNRLPVLFGSLMALSTFQREGKMDWLAAWKIVLPATLGSVAGVYLAETLHNRQLGLAITAAVLVALLLLFTKLKEALAKDYHRTPRVTVFGLSALFVVGVWLGFIVLDGATYPFARADSFVRIRFAARKRSQGLSACDHHLGADRSLCSRRRYPGRRGSFSPPAVFSAAILVRSCRARKTREPGYFKS